MYKWRRDIACELPFGSLTPDRLTTEPGVSEMEQRDLEFDTYAFAEDAHWDVLPELPTVHVSLVETKALHGRIAWKSSRQAP